MTDDQYSHRLLTHSVVDRHVAGFSGHKGRRHSGWTAKRLRKGIGNDSTHWRTGTLGMTWSTRWAVGEDAAGQKRVELVGDKRWQARAASFDVNAGEKRVEVFLHHAVERGFLGAVALVPRRVCGCGAGRCWAHGRATMVLASLADCMRIQYCSIAAFQHPWCCDNGMPKRGIDPIWFGSRRRRASRP